MRHAMLRAVAPLPLFLTLLALAASAPSWAQGTCDAGTSFTYSFTSNCSYPIWIGQRSTGDPASYPPQGDNWALAAACTMNADCASGICDQDSGQCVCSDASQCSGGAACLANGKCSTSAQFCMPKDWNSGTFWPRTGCVLDASVSPATLTCETGSCYDTSNTGQQLLDCSLSNRGGSPTNPATQFEVTSTPTSLNYDVSIAAGFNVESSVAPVGGGRIVPGTPATDIAACLTAGCRADLNTTCPADLKVVRPDDPNKTIGCLDPCTQCQRSAGNLDCQMTFPGETYTDCNGGTGSVTYEDMYCAENKVDGKAQASPNQGTPTAFGPSDCFPGTTFVQPTFQSSYELPEGQGVCLYTTPPQFTIPHFNDYGWFDAASQTTKNCGGTPPNYLALPDGTSCGGYLTPQKDGSSGYPQALGYTCQTAAYEDSTQSPQTAHLCMPPTGGGLGKCVANTLGNVPLYDAVAGVANPSWLAAGKKAGGGTPYYETFKTACPSAYAWQYDDHSSGFECDATKTVPNGQTFSGFHVTFCGSMKPSSLVALPPVSAVALHAHGWAQHVGSGGENGHVRIDGSFWLPEMLPLDRAVFTLGNVLDESGAAGELTRARGGEPLAPLALTARPGNRPGKATFETPAGARPSVKVEIEADRDHPDRMTFDLTVKHVTLAAPVRCSGKKGSQTQLETSFVLQTGSRPDVLVGAFLPWECLGQKLRR